MPAMAETSCGTMILSVRTTRGVYLACDSRATNPSRDDAQKIFMCGSFAFIAICGVIVLSGTKRTTEGEALGATINLMKTLEHFSMTNAVNGDNFVIYLGQVMIVSIRAFWDECVSPYPEAVRSAMVSSPSEVFTIAGIVLIGDQVRVFAIHFPYASNGGLADPTYEYQDTEQVVGWGQTDGVVAPDSELTHLRSVIDYLTGAYRRSAERHPDSVGGQIDVGLIDTNGARWIAKK